MVPEDKDALASLKSDLPHLYNTIRFDLLPDPVSGNIDAPLCMILINPGVAPIDEYNYCSVDKLTKDKVRAEMAAKNHKIAFRFEKSGTESVQLQNRRDVLLKQYLLTPGTVPYSLDESFNTVDLTGPTGRGARLRCGSFLWTRYLFGIKRDLEKTRKIFARVFDLEFFPYHTENFSVQRYMEWENRQRQLNLPLLAHSTFRDELIGAFAKDDRIFIVRSNFVKDYMIQRLKVKNSRICCFKNPQAAYLTRNNLKCESKKTLAVVFDELEI